MSQEPRPGLSREFVLRSILRLFDEVESERRWGAVTVLYQAGKFRCIEEKKTTTEEEK